MSGRSVVPEGGSCDEPETSPWEAGLTTMVSEWRRATRRTFLHKECRPAS